MDRGTGSGIAAMFDRGGVFMWPLLILAVVAAAIIVERLITLHRQRDDTRQLMSALIQSIKSGGVDSARELCLNTRGPIAAILHAGLTKVHRGPTAVERAIENAGSVELAFLQRNLPVLAAIASLAPLLGFLGTISGMIHAFDAIAAADLVSMKVVGRGVAEALITTLAGLVIAVPAQAAHSLFVARIDRFVIEMEASSIELLDALLERDGG
jgi:biopolymer transport protein ExbB